MKQRGGELKVGDVVLVRRLAFDGKHKLETRWEPGEYEVVKQAEGLPVYTVAPVGGKGRRRMLHRNHLLPVGFLRQPHP